MGTPAANPPINIWIHGTLLIRQRLFVEAFGSTPGLKKAVNIEEQFFTHKIAHILHAKDPVNFPLDTFYAFGWSGKLSNQERLNAAQTLYVELTKIIEEYIAHYGTYPVIRLLTHSHGGNVALNLAFIQEKFNKNLHIDSLVLLACPVQKNTMPCTRNVMFKHIYSLYSSLDMVQIIAPQSCNERLPFSGRVFPAALNIVQAKVRMNGHAILHTEFTSARFIKTIPLLIKALQKFEKTEQHKMGKRIVLRIQTRPKRKHKTDLLNGVAYKKTIAPSVARLV